MIGLLKVALGGIVREIIELPAAFKRGWRYEMEYRERRDDNYYRDKTD